VAKRTGRDLEPFRGKPAQRGDSAATHAEIQQLIAPIKVSYVDPSALTAAPRNARQHSERQVTQIAASINEFGFIVPIVTDEQGTVLAGHGRLAAARQLGLPKVPVVKIGHLNDAQKRAFRLADNRLAELPTADWQGSSRGSIGGSQAAPSVFPVAALTSNAKKP